MAVAITATIPMHFCTQYPCPHCSTGYYLAPPQSLIHTPPQGCICPPTSEQTCLNPHCPRGATPPLTFSSTSMIVI
jgi:hypothetical protein